jgi:hypothetical protein
LNWHRLTADADDKSGGPACFCIRGLSQMEGDTNDEVADQLGSARRTIARRLELIRRTWVSFVEEI